MATEAVALPYVSHLAADAITVGGVPLLMPFSKHRFSLGLMRTGHVMERLVCTPLISISAGAVAWVVLAPAPRSELIPQTVVGAPTETTHCRPIGVDAARSLTVVAFHASRPGFDVPADLVRVNHTIGTNREVVTEQYRNVIERCYGCLARCISHDIGRFPSANHAPRSPIPRCACSGRVAWCRQPYRPIMRPQLPGASCV